MFVLTLCVGAVSMCVPAISVCLSLCGLLVRELCVCDGHAYVLCMCMCVLPC